MRIIFDICGYAQDYPASSQPLGVMTYEVGASCTHSNLVIVTIAEVRITHIRLSYNLVIHHFSGVWINLYCTDRRVLVHVMQGTGMSNEVYREFKVQAAGAGHWQNCFSAT